MQSHPCQLTINTTTRTKKVIGQPETLFRSNPNTPSATRKALGGGGGGGGGGGQVGSGRKEDKLVGYYSDVDVSPQKTENSVYVSQPGNMAEL